MAPFAGAEFGNPMSITQPGITARESIERARADLANLLGARADELIFTSSGTESTNLAILGVMRAAPSGSHLLISAIEHHAVLEPAKALASAGYDTELVAVTQSGIIEPRAIMARIKPTTRLISVMYANNEIGTVQPIAEIGRALRRLNRHRAGQGLDPVLFHTDACQAPGYLPVRVAELGVDALSLNAAKIGGPKGSGLLYLRRGIALTPLMYGGGQEQGRRAGTESVAAIVGLASAMRIAAACRDDEVRRMSNLRDQLLVALERGIPDLIVHGDRVHRLPNNLCVAIPGIDAEALVLYLDHDGVYVGTGAACSNLTLEPSHVLTALGVAPTVALATIRLSLGYTTQPDEIARAAQLILARVEWLRAKHRVHKLTTPPLAN